MGKENDAVIIAPFQKEKKSWFREKVAYFVKGELDRKAVWRCCHRQAEESLGKHIRFYAKVMFPDDLRVQQEFRLAAAKILDYDKDARESVDYMADSGEAAVYCSWLWDKKKADMHMDNVAKMGDIVVSNVSYLAVEDMRARGIITESFDYYLDRGATLFVKDFLEKTGSTVSIDVEKDTVSEKGSTESVPIKHTEKEPSFVRKGTVHMKPTHKGRKEENTASQER